MASDWHIYRGKVQSLLATPEFSSADVTAEVPSDEDSWIEERPLTPHGPVDVLPDVVARALAVADVPVVEFDLAEVLEQVQIWLKRPVFRWHVSRNCSYFV